MAETDQTVEATGANVEAAVEEGLARLGVTREAVEIEVLEEGGRGVFGLGGRDARVRLTIKAQATGPDSVRTAPSTGEPEATVSRAEAPDLASEKGEVAIAREVLAELLTLMGMEGIRVNARRAEAAGDDEEPP